MKKVFYLTILVILGSCTKFDDALYDSRATALVTPGPAYAELRDLIDDAGWWFWAQEVTSDEIAFPIRGTDWNDGGKWKVLHTHEWTNDVDAVNSMWSHINDGIRETNKLLDILEPSAGDPQIDLSIAKMKTLRAFFQYLLMDNYGDVPLITSFANAPEFPEKTNRKEIYDFLIKDLEENVSKLPVNTNKFAVSRGMGFTLLAKLYINAEVYTGTPAYDKAESYCDSVINLGIYTLDNTVTKPFSATNENVAENIFTIPFDEFNAPGFRIHMRTLHYLSDATFGMKVGPWNGFAALEDHYNIYGDNDKRKQAWFLVGPQKDLNGNPLFDETAGVNLSFNPNIPKLVMDGSNSLEEIRMSGARVSKYEVENGAVEDLNNDFPLFRYADILLMKAECAVRNGAPGSGDTYVDQVRSRANAGPTSGFGLTEILAERGREMFCEGHRRQDLIRFGEFNKAWWEKKASSPERTIFPIPQWAIDANSNLGK